MPTTPRLLAPVAAGLAACVAAPPANPEFDDAAKFAFLAFEEDEATLAYALRALEAQLYLSLDVEARSIVDRAVALSRLTDADVADLERPDRPAGDAVPVALAGTSPFGPEHHQHIQLLADQTPVEPYSPDHYDRTFLDGTDACWLDQGCPHLYTYNELTKVNALMSVPFAFNKTFRWVDLSLPDPADLPSGEDVVGDGEPRWAFVARSWTTREYEGENGRAAINQSYTVEFWIPRDGRGFLREEAPDLPWTADSTGGGSLRFLALWHETDLGIPVGDTVVEATTRGGIQDNFDAADAWLEERFGDG